MKKDVIKTRKIAGTAGYLVSEEGNIFTKSGRLMRPQFKNGVLKIHLYNQQGFRKFLLVKDLVLWSFEGKKDYEISHKNGDPTDCSLSNLEYDKSKKVFREVEQGGSKKKRQTSVSYTVFNKPVKNQYYDGIDEARLLTRGGLDEKIEKSLQSIRKARGLK